jgi:hypothetical protein
MTFNETDIFTARIVELIDDESYAELQSVLVGDPGPVISSRDRRAYGRSDGEEAVGGSAEVSE